MFRKHSYICCEHSNATLIVIMD
ncbi:hypothetical protein Taro_008742, partial [Colocasia esculenta]|nr:hypothetical protein [Colocasia esculenta]